MEIETPKENGAEMEVPMTGTILKDPETGRFLPGHAGPGRPKGSQSLTTKVKLALEKTFVDAKTGEQHTFYEAFINKILHKGITEGDPTIMRLIWNYLDGMPLQGIELRSKVEVSIDDIRFLIDALPEPLRLKHYANLRELLDDSARLQSGTLEVEDSSVGEGTQRAIQGQTDNDA